MSDSKQKMSSFCCSSFLLAALMARPIDSRNYILASTFFGLSYGRGISNFFIAEAWGVRGAFLGDSPNPEIPPLRILDGFPPLSFKPYDIDNFGFLGEVRGDPAALILSWLS